jgi:hypothetical protein
VLLPALIWLTVRMLPTDVLAECRQQAEDWMTQAGTKPRNAGGDVLILAIWVALAAILLYWLAALL